MCAQELLVLDCQCLHQRVVGLNKFLDPFVLELPGHVHEGNAQALDVSQDAARLLPILRFCCQVRFSGTIQKLGARNAITSSPPNSRTSNFATELSCSQGAPQPVKIALTRHPSSCLDSSSIDTNSGDLFALESTPLRHLLTPNSCGSGDTPRSPCCSLARPFPAVPATARERATAHPAMFPPPPGCGTISCRQVR
jgi:hypothetical protein